MQQFDDLIRKYVNGMLSEKEYSKLLSLINMKPENYNYFKNYIKTWEPEINILTDKNWRSLNYKLSSLPNNITSSKKQKLIHSISKVAAILILGLILGAVISYLGINNKFQHNSIVFEAPRGEKSIITLSDGTKVWLNGGSTIELNRSFNFNSREINLKGEAYFEVIKNKNNPFKVFTEDVTIKVLGTKFNVSAYSDDEYVKAVVKQGLVQVASENSSKLLKSNQQASYNKNTKKMDLDNVDAETLIAWKNNMLIFENEHYLKVFKKLENWYGVDITVKSEAGLNPFYTMTIKTETLTELLKLINIISPIEYKINGDKVEIIITKMN